MFKYKLSICLITYNHELFIEKALNGVFSQNTNFDIELVIGDDASTDNTRALINKLLPPPHIKINTQFRDKNLGMLKNFSSTLQECSGQYIALLEGDDYWIDPDKLHRQIDFLDNNPDFSMCYHPVKIDSGGAKLSPQKGDRKSDVFDIYDLARGNFMHTCSVVFRAKLFDQFPAQFYNSTVGDYFLHMLNAQHGKIKKISSPMGVYRIHQGGVWSMQPDMDIKILTYLEAMIGCFADDIEDILKQRHRDIAYQSFCNRIAETGFDERLLRCTKYGSSNFASKLGELIERDKKKRNSLVNRLRNYADKIIN
jgi:glycosyltransferase involved in cell wall biosynthesis